ncbi:MAG TPA: amidohydrolase family protein, partial [Acidimicrobiales bacterium]|nr:amidohydrolase family protein [Acidimicrobiales bacterium]
MAGARFDADMHLYETRDLWARYLDPGQRHLALSIVDDDLGHAWLTQGDRRIDLAEVHHPGDLDAMGAYRQRVRHGLPPEVPFDEALPLAFHDPEARLAQLDEFGLDAAVTFPNYGLLWERPLQDRLEATLANMHAWNRYVGEVAAAGRGRLYPVAHLSLRDLNWLEAELAQLSAAGVRLAMVAPALVDGKPLSHPDLDRAWSLFEEHDVAPVFHVSAFPHPFHDEWYDTDPDSGAPVLSSVFIWSAPALAICDLAIHGVFEAHPRLRLGVMELSAIWVPMFLLMMDGGFDFHARFNGQPLRSLPLRPSEYVRRQVRVAVFCYEGPRRLIRDLGEDMLMFSSDYPHAEGIAQPVADYERITGPVDGRAGEQLYAGNLEWLV